VPELLVPGLEPTALLLLLLAAFAAGFIDSIAGGGGLITIPALLLLHPAAPIAALLATNKASSIAGTAGAAWTYSRKVPLPWPLLLPAMAGALLGSFLGARTVAVLDPSLVKPAVLAVLAVLILLALYTWWRPDLGHRETQSLAGKSLGWAGFVLGASLGFYDGLLGPGTGSLLMVALIVWFGRDFLQATAAAKFINGMSNLGALLWFAAAGLVLWKLALPMAACNWLGGQLGSRMALGKGNGWIRRIFLVVVWALIARLAWNLIEFN
jgi:uncharacterized membrane protein YfcA